MPANAVSFQTFLSTQLEDLRLRLVTEFERLHGDGSAAQLSGGFVTVQGQDGEVPLVDGNTSVPVCSQVHTGCSAGTLSSLARQDSPAIVASSTLPDNNSLAHRGSFDGEHTPLAPVVHRNSWSEGTPASSRLVKSLESPARSSPTRGQTVCRESTLSTRYQSADTEPEVMIAGNGVIIPGSLLFLTWSNFVSVTVLLSCFLTPLRFAFFEDGATMNMAEMALDLIFGFDILLGFNVAVISKHGLETDRAKIFVEHALSFRFAIDVIAMVPWDNLWSSFHEDNDANREIASALRLLRLLKANNLLILFRGMQKNTHFNLLGVVVAKFVVFILICTHTVGCVFYKLAEIDDFGENTWVKRGDPDLPLQPLSTRYMHVLFWAVGTFKAGPASGSLIPTSNSEMLLACLTMMVNICLHTYLISNMAALLTTADVRIYNMRRELNQVRDFAARFNLPRELHLQLRSLVKFKFSTNDEVDQSLLSGLPDLYRQRISHALFDDLVKSVDLFRSCSSVFLRELHSNLTATLHMPNSQLSTVDGSSSSLQIVAEGEAELLHRSGSILEICREGECFTAVAFLCKVAQPYSVRTRMACRVLSIGGAAWESACTAFPDSLEQVRHNLLVHCEDKVAEFAASAIGATIYNELLMVVKAYIVHQEELTIAMICSAAARGDLVYLKRRLVASTPNCANYDQRTPLHLAAAHGQLETCVMLLEARAAPDPMDNFGHTPLLEACRGRHEDVADLLYAKGAKFHGRAGTTAEIWQAAVDVEQLWYLRSLLRYNIDPNSGDYDARTPLHVANASGNHTAVELLVAQPNILLDPQDNFGRTPLMEAVRHGHEACARLLKAQGAFHGFLTDLKSSSSNAIPAGQELCQAAFANQWNYLHNLLTYCGLDVDSGDYDLRTGLMLASAEGNMKVALSLLQNKADINRKDRWGHTAITEAQDHGHQELAKMLKLFGAENSQANGNSSTWRANLWSR